MRLRRRFRPGELRLGRIEAFSDGVFAIVVTLLVLELKVSALRDAGSAIDMLTPLFFIVPPPVAACRTGRREGLVGGPATATRPDEPTETLRDRGDRLAGRHVR